jgi:eukaryotic-like serine/threonine-protein kinase
MNILRLWPEIEPLLDQALELDLQQRLQWLTQLDVTRPDIAPVVRELVSQHQSLDTDGHLHGSMFEKLRSNIASVVHELVSQHQSSVTDGYLRGSVFEKLADLAPSLQKLLTERASIETSGPDSSPHPLGLAAGAVIGHYRLIREIGRGGMSNVWLAEHSDGQLKREVALKLPFLWQRMQVERFQRERDLLAALTHPRIARLYDAGVSDSGQPYLAMEYVAGSTLLENCDQGRWSIPQRLRIFLQVLEAVQFAHARLIIHRDLKPSNVLVTAEGHVALLDFGIGKLLSGDADRQAPLTQLPGHALTPEYASPEQIAGQSLGIASDIYSLGVILFELLTGTGPYHLERNSQAALEEAILNESVHRPSRSDISAPAAIARGSSVRALKSLLAGDLDAIVIKALKKNPADRYASVTAFVQDITNYLHHLPVSAQPDSYRYRAGKFLARHRVPVAAASFALCALLAGTGIALWQARAAAIQSNRALASASQNEAIGYFFDTIISEAAFAEKPVTVRKLLARGAQLALQSSHGNPEGRAAVLGMIASTYVGLFEVEQAQQLTDAALNLLAQSSERGLRSKLRCLRAYIDAKRGAPEAAIAQIKAELLALDDDARTASSCLDDLANICAESPQVCARGESLRYSEQALALLQTAPNPTDITVGTEATLLAKVAYGHHSNGGDYRQADRLFAQALQKYVQVGRQDSGSGVIARHNWAVVAETEGRPKHALVLFEEVLRLDAQRDPDAHPSTITVHSKARALTAIGRFAEAHDTLELLCRLSETRDDAFSRSRCAVSSASLAIQTGALPRARDFIERAERLLATDYAPDDPVVFMLAVVKGQYEMALGHFTEARAHFDRTVAQGSGTASTASMTALLGLAEVELALGNPSKASVIARRALDATRSKLGDFPYSHRVGQANLLLGRALQQLGQPIPARMAFQEAVTHLANTVDAQHPALVQARQLLSL